MSRIIIHIKDFEKDTCNLKNILNRLCWLHVDFSGASDIVEYRNRKIIPVESILEDDTVIDCTTSWKDIENLIK